MTCFTQELFQELINLVLTSKTQPAIACSKLTAETVEQGVCSMFTIKTPERRLTSFAFIVNFKHIFHTLI